MALFVPNLTNKAYITSISNIESLGYDLVNISRSRLVGVTLNVAY